MTNGPILRRELTELTDAVRQIPAPPTPQLAEPYSVRVANETDADMVAEWMNRPHLAQAWEYDWPVARWRRYLSAQLDGSYSLPLFVSLRGVDRAYVELYRAAKDSIAPRYRADPYDLGIHAAIADPEFVSRGFAPLLLPQLMASIFALESRCSRIVFDPDHRNSATRRLCEYVGCTFLGEHVMTNRRMALYGFDRPITAS